MPTVSKSSRSTPRPSEVASDIKRRGFQWARQWMQQQQLRPGTALFPNPQPQPSRFNPDEMRRYPTISVQEGDPIDAALEWQEELHYSSQDDFANRVLVVNMANDRKAGGDWDSGTIGPEECLARRSNLAQQLKTEWNTYNPTNSHYPIPARGGLYTPNTIILRHGSDDYGYLCEPKSLAVVSVAPVRRPKLSVSGNRYAFEQEKELMMEKMRTILRIAAIFGHRNLCMGAFGTGPTFRNPVGEVAHMWQELLFEDPEFYGCFESVIFAIDPKQAGSTRTRLHELQTFTEAFDPQRIFYQALH